MKKTIQTGIIYASGGKEMCARCRKERKVTGSASVMGQDLHLEPACTPSAEEVLLFQETGKEATDSQR